MQHYRAFCFVRFFSFDSKYLSILKLGWAAAPTLVIALLIGIWATGALSAQPSLFAVPAPTAPQHAKAPPAADGLYFTQTYAVTAPCDSSDIVYRNSINGTTPGDGTPKSEGWKIRPWLDVPIKIVSAGIIYMTGARPQWLMIGSNIIGDSMVFLSEGETQHREVFPAGKFKWMPPRSQTGTLDYFDLHGACKTPWWRRWTRGLATMTVFVDFGYTED